MRSIVALLRAGSPSGRDSAAWALAELAAVDVYGTRAAMRREKVTALIRHATQPICQLANASRRLALLCISKVSRSTFCKARRRPRVLICH